MGQDRADGSPHRRQQPPYFYEPLPVQADFSETAMLVLLLWGSGGVDLRIPKTCRAAAREYLGLAAAQVSDAEKEIYRLLKLDRWKTVPSPADAIASAVVIGILETEAAPHRDRTEKGKKDADGIEDVVLVREVAPEEVAA